MKEITIIIPVHVYDDNVDALLTKAMDSVEKNKQNTDVTLKTMIVCPADIEPKLSKFAESKNDVKFAIKEGNTDFCSMVNFGASQCGTDYFSILEFDDEYTAKWFKNVKEYYFTHEDVSVFLPINVTIDAMTNAYKFENEISWSNAFAKDELGMLDADSIDDYISFNITGGVFNTNDFVTVGGLKPSIEVAFNHEFLLRVAKKNLKIFVVPKEGYRHIIGREGSLFLTFMNKTDDELAQWFALARRESNYTEDRKKGLESIKSETVK